MERVAGPSTAHHRGAGQWRAPRDLDAAGPTGSLADGRAVVSFASNDYLGLSQHPAVKAAARGAIDRWGTGSGSARLIVGSRPVHRELELELAAWKEAEAALAVPHGLRRQSPACSRRSPAGACSSSATNSTTRRSSTARGWRAPRSLSTAMPTSTTPARCSRRIDGPTILITDRVFSMDGDVAPVEDCSTKLARHGAEPPGRRGARGAGPRRSRVRGPSPSGDAVQDARLARWLRRRSTSVHRPA